MVALIIFYLTLSAIPILFYVFSKYTPWLCDRKAWKAWKACYDHSNPVLVWKSTDNYRFEFPNLGYCVYVFNYNDQKNTRTCVFRTDGNKELVFSSYYKRHSKKMLEKLKKFI